MKIRLLIDGQPVSATLDDNAAARDFLAMLPLTLSLSDYAFTEKIADLPQKLSTHDAPAGYAADIGDITYYAPWGNLAIFYRSFKYASGLVRLGRLEAGVDLLRGKESLTVILEAAS
ncbi:TPA: hypothetical protein L4E59_005283 [Pseudomonas aeruginosa]|nr:hypothetical protein [Pseudomonas aeruginosa]